MQIPSTYSIIFQKSNFDSDFYFLTLSLDVQAGASEAVLDGVGHTLQIFEKSLEGMIIDYKLYFYCLKFWGRVSGRLRHPCGCSTLFCSE